MKTFSCLFDVDCWVVTNVGSFAHAVCIKQDTGMILEIHLPHIVRFERCLRVFLSFQINLNQRLVCSTLFTQTIGVGGGSFFRSKIQMIFRTTENTVVHHPLFTCMDIKSYLSFLDAKSPKDTQGLLATPRSWLCDWARPSWRGEAPKGRECCSCDCWASGGSNPTPSAKYRCGLMIEGHPA